MAHSQMHLGYNGEQVVASWLQERGFTILQQNYRSRWGEIDVISAKDDIIAFVEVKTRSTRYFSIASVVTKSKQQKLIKTAKQFIIEHNVSDKVLRFDIATVLHQDDTYSIDYIPNAFMAK